VIGSNFPGMAPIIEDAGCGLLVDPERADQIAEAVLRSLEDPALHERFSAQARDAARRYCWENQVERLLAVYRDLSARQRSQHILRVS
jgi:glycosyltransferase involved in cell wall biosynthesis